MAEKREMVMVTSANASSDVFWKDLATAMAKFIRLSAEEKVVETKSETTVLCALMLNDNAFSWPVLYAYNWKEVVQKLCTSRCYSSFFSSLCHAIVHDDPGKELLIVKAELAGLKDLVDAIEEGRLW